MTQISEGDPAPVNLTEKAKKINAAVLAAEASAKSAVQHALAAGNLLIEAKKAIGHGGWQKWVVSNCDLAPRTARAYMRLAETLPKLPELERQRARQACRRQFRNRSAT